MTVGFQAFLQFATIEELF